MRSCGEMKPKKELIRVVRCEDGNFVLDATGKKNGRGAYICNSGDCLGKAVKSKGLERSFKQAIPPEVYERLEKEMNEIESKIKYYRSLVLRQKRGRQQAASL